MYSPARPDREFGYAVGGIRNTAAYAEALAIVAKQLGRDPVHHYLFDEDAGTGEFTFRSHVEIDFYPLRKAGFTAEKRV